MSTFIFVMLFPLMSFAGTLTGDWVQGRRADYRYVTNYEVETIQKPFRGVPWIQEDCHDAGDRFANWSRTVAYEITYNGGLSFDLLGVGFELGASRSQSVELAFERWIHATDGIKARHVLHEEYENWIGETRVEFRNDNGETYFGSKVYPFRLNKMNYGLFVKRDVLEVCTP